jgi:hypothetical protein
MEAKYLACSKCKKEKFTNPTAWDDRVRKFGSEEKMKKEWKCRDCSNFDKYGVAGVPLPKIKKEKKKKAVTDEEIEDEIVDEENENALDE